MSETKNKLLDYIKSPECYISVVLAIMSIILPILYQTIHDKINNYSIINVYQNKTIVATPEIKSIIDKNYYGSNLILNGKCIYQIDFVNSSDNSIYEDDFLENIIISTNKNYKIYAAYIVVPQETGTYFSEKIEMNENNIVIHPFLFNKNEKITILSIVDKESDLFIQYRINNAILHYKNFLLTKFSINIITVKFLLMIFVFYICTILIALRKGIEKRFTNPSK